MIYLDNAATSLNKPKLVKESVIYAMNNLTANPGRSGHNLSQNVANEIFSTRELIKEFFKAEDYDVIFSKNCTESLNLAIIGFLKSGDHVITTCYEHNSVLRPLKYLQSKGIEVEILDCELTDFHDQLLYHIKPNTKMVITTAISNVTGDICDLKRVGEICLKNNLIYLVDGAQGCGHIEINVEDCKIDMLAFAGHKGLLALTGVGGLIKRKRIKLSPILFGGTGVDSKNLIQNTETIEGYESGTLPSVSIISLKAGVEFLKKNFLKIQKKEHDLSEYLYNSLKKLDFLEVYSKENSLNVFSFNVKNLDSSCVANILNEEYNICVRSGLHCAPLIHKKLKTQDVGAVRVSLDFNNTIEDIECLIFALKKISTF